MKFTFSELLIKLRLILMSDKLIEALDEVKTLPVITLETIVERVQEESLLILSLVCILPFMQPIPIPGLSSVLGLIVLLQGIGLVVSGKPLLTQRLKKVVIPQDKFEKIYLAAKKFSIFTSKISTFKHSIATTRASQIICGLSIVISAAFLSLPLPIPFSNFIPALGIFFICVGLLEDDIILVLCGNGITLSVIWMAMFSYHLILEQWRSWFA